MRAALHALWARWRAPVHRSVRARLRVALGLAALYEFWSLLPAAAWLGSEGPGPTWAMARIYPSELHTPCVFYFLPTWAALMLLAAGAGAAVALSVGFYPRCSGVLLWVVLVGIRQRWAWGWADGGLQVLPAMLFFWLWIERGKEEWLDSWPVRLMQLQLSLIYVQSGYYKLLGQQWWEGEALRLALLNPEFARWNLDGWLSQPGCKPFMLLGSWVTMVWECSFPVLLLLHPWTRRVALGLGVFFHSMLWLLMPIGVFPFAMLVPYLSFTGPSAPATARAVAKPGRLRQAWYSFQILVLLWIAWPERSLLPPQSRVPGWVQALDRSLVAGHALVGRIPGTGLLDGYARWAGMDHRFHTFSPAVAAFAVSYQVWVADRRLWGELPTRSFRPDAQVVAKAVGSHQPAAVYLALLGWQRWLTPREPLILREFWSPLPCTPHSWLPGRTWLVTVGDNGIPMLSEQK